MDRRLLAIQSCIRARLDIRPGKLPSSGHIRGPERERVRTQNHIKYADVAATVNAAMNKWMLFSCWSWITAVSMTGEFEFAQLNWMFLM